MIIDLKEGVVDLPKIGPVRWSRHRKIEGKPKNLTVIREGEWWFASIICEVDLAEGYGPKLDVVGIDRNIKAPLALSTGQFVDLPRMSDGEAKRRKCLEQGIARCVEQRKEREKEAGQALRRSRNEMKLRAALRRLHAALRRRLNDALHKVTTLLAKNHSVVVVEDLRIKNMTASARGTVEEPGTNVRQKAGLNRSLLALAPARFALLLGYKCQWYGSRLVAVPAPYTSQYCSACRRHPKDDPATRHLEHGRDGMWFSCPLCGHEEHADLNAAKNIEWAGRQILAAERLDQYDEHTAGGHPVSAWGALCESMAVNHEASVLTEGSLAL